MLFITDGQDGYYPRNRGKTSASEEYDMISAQLKSKPNLQTKFLSVGFSRGHDAAFMNRIANFGSEQGNFIFIDSYNEGWRDEMNQSLCDTLDIALESAATFKFSIVNSLVGYEAQTSAESNFVARDNVMQTEKVQQPQQDAEEEEKKDGED